MEIILASNSPRRKELLELAKVPFCIKTKNTEEILEESLPIPKRIEKIAFSKAQAVAKENENALVIGADTVVVVNDLILGKPKSKDDAIAMIKLLQGNVHQVITAVAMITKDKTEIFHDVTKVKFYEMSDDEINDYVLNQDIYDKAGAYAIQGDASIYIEAIEGDYYNVMGLPIAKVIRKLKTF